MLTILKELMSSGPSATEIDIDIPPCTSQDHPLPEDPVVSSSNIDSNSSELGEPRNLTNSPSITDPMSLSPSRSVTGTDTETQSPNPPSRYPSRQHQPTTRFSDTQTW